MQKEKSRAREYCCHQQLKEIELEPIEQAPLGNKNSAETDSWEQLAMRGFLIDKSLLIRDLTDNTIVVRPRKWGKSTNLSMLQYFYECPLNEDGTVNEKKLYKKRSLFIGSKRNQQQYLPNLLQKLSPRQIDNFKKEIQKFQFKPSKLAQFWDKKMNNMPSPKQEFGNYIVFKIQGKFVIDCELNYKIYCNLLHNQVLGFFQQHLYLKAKFEQIWDNSYKVLKQAINNQNKFTAIHDVIIRLGRMLDKFHQKKIIILIDEYDHAFTSSILDSPDKQPSNDSKKILHYLNTFLGGFIKAISKQYIRLVVCCGIRFILNKEMLSPASYKLQSVEKTEDLSQYYGFTQSQIKEQLILKNFKDETEKQKKSNEVLLKTIKRLYNGYKIEFKNQSKTSENYLCIFNPYSVVNYVKKCVRAKQIFDFCNKQMSKKICFWLSSSPNWTVISKYIDNLKHKDEEFTSYLFKTLLKNAQRRNKQQILQKQKQEQESYGQNKLVLTFKSYQLKDTIVNKSLANYQLSDFIDLLVETGYLTRMNDKIMIPNQEIMLFYDQIVFQFIKRKFKEIQDKTKIQQSVDIANWKQCSTFFQRVISQFLKRFRNFCQPIFTTLLMTSFITSDDRYQFLYQSKMFQVQPDIIFIPTQGAELPILIHEHKIISGKSSQLAKKKKADEAIFQIFHKNYFRLVLDDAYPRLRWKQIIIRGVVAHYQSLKFQIFAHEMTFKREQVQALSLMSSHLFKRDSKVLSFEEMILPRKIKQKLKNTDQFLTTILSLYIKSILLKNVRLLQIFKICLFDQINKQKSDRKKRRRPPSAIILQLNEKKIQNLIHYLKVRYFAFQPIQLEFKKEIKTFFQTEETIQWKNQKQSIQQIERIFQTALSTMKQEEKRQKETNSRSREKHFTSSSRRNMTIAQQLQKKQDKTQSEQRRPVSQKRQVSRITRNKSIPKKKH